MHRIAKGIFALALLVWGCAGAPDAAVQQTNCDPIGKEEALFVNHQGYNADACSRTDRMSDVMIGLGEEGDPDPATIHLASAGDIGTEEQPIKIPGGIGLPVVFDSRNNLVESFQGGSCPYDVTWTTARPLIGSCLIPNSIDDLNFAVWDGYGPPGSSLRNYMIGVVQRAWNAWSRPATCGSVTLRSHLKTPGTAMLNSGNIQQDFFLTRIPIYPDNNNTEQTYSARSFLDEATYVAQTPVRNGIRYYGWKDVGIGINHDLIEGVKIEACLSPNDTQRAVKLTNAYVYIVAHELGHLWGLPHMSTSIMRTGSNTTCSQLFPPDGVGPLFSQFVPPISTGIRFLINDEASQSGFSTDVVTSAAACIPDVDSPVSGTLNTEFLPL